MNTRPWLWIFFWGIPGVREIVLVALVTLVLYGRTGLQVARRRGGLPGWLMPVVRRTSPPGRPGPAPAPPATALGMAAARRRDRLFWFLAIVAAAAVAAWIVTRTLIVAAPKPSL
jgi:hypothetical protein